MALKDDLENKALRATVETIEDTATAIWKMCGARKDLDAKEILLKNVHPLVLEKLSEAQKDLLENGPPSEEQETSLVDALKEPLIQLQVANELLDKRFKRVLGRGGYQICEITNLEKKTLKPLDDKTAPRRIEAVLSKDLAQLRVTPPTAIISEMRRLWENHVEEISDPEPMLRPEEEGWCYHRPAVFPDESCEFPQWQKILDRLSDPKAFAAWIWGVYSGEYKGRRMVWLHGEKGEDGKSAITKLIADQLFGPAHQAISNAQVSGQEKRFLTSFFVNSRLVIYPDANNTKVLMTEQFKTVASAGSDPVPIEFKGKTGYSDVLKARMWICSNYEPFVSMDNFVLSRLLYIQIQPMIDETPDPKAIDRLKEQLPGFLHYAKTAWEDSKIQNGYDIDTLEGTKIKVEELQKTSYEDFHDIVGRYFDITNDPEDKLEAHIVKTILTRERMGSGPIVKDFKQWLKSTFGVEHHRGQRGNFYTGIRERIDENEAEDVAETEMESMDMEDF